MPSQNPGKESSGGDVESFVPDSSSIPDDMFFGGIYIKIIFTLIITKFSVRLISYSLAKQHTFNVTI